MFNWEKNKQAIVGVAIIVVLIIVSYFVWQSRDKEYSEDYTKNGKTDTDPSEDKLNDKDYWKEIAGQSLIQAKQQGKLPAGLERLYQEIFAAPKVAWYDELRNYLYQIDGYNYRDIPPNKRHRKVMLPSVYGEEIKFTFAVDTSGSMSDTDLKLAANELEGIFGSFESCKIRVIACDAAVTSDELWEGYSSLQEDVVKMRKMFKGGGGTDFRPVFDIQDEDTTLLIFFTDGYGSFPDHAPPYDVIWIRREGDLAVESFPFGRVLTIPKE
jgi:predicted metal-dependent peptidase